MLTGSHRGRCVGPLVSKGENHDHSSRPYIGHRELLLQSKEVDIGGNMSAATLTSKGQMTIPAEVRQALQVEAGDRIEFVEVEPGRFEMVAATRSVRDLKGMFGTPAKHVSIEEMNRAITTRRVSAQ